MYNFSSYPTSLIHSSNNFFAFTNDGIISIYFWALTTHVVIKLQTASIF